MSFWSHLGSVASSVVDDVGNGIGTAWNLAKVTYVPQAITAVGDTLSHGYVSSSDLKHGDVAPPKTRDIASAAPVVGALNMAFTRSSHGAAYGLQSIYDDLSHGYVTSGDLKSMRSRNLTYGQGFVGTVGGGLTAGQLTSPSQIKQQATSGSWYMPARLATGSIDAAFGWFGAPDVLALKGVGELRDATRIASGADLAALKGAQEAGTTKGLTLAQKAQNRTMNGFLQATDGKSSAQLMQMRAFRDTPGADSLASLLAGANDIADPIERLSTKQTLFRAALGNQDDIAKLQQMAPKSYSDLMNARTGLDNQTAELHLAQLTGVDKNGARVAPQTLATWQQELADKTAEFNTRYKDALDQEIRVNQSARIFDGHIPTYGVLDKARVGTLAGKQTVFQGGIFSTPLNVWHIGVNTFMGARPSGVVNLHDANDVIKNLTWQIQRTRGVSPEQAQDWINRVVTANTDADRFHALQAVEHQIFEHVGRQALGTDTSADVLNKIIQDYRSQHALARSKFFGAPPSQSYTAVTGQVAGDTDNRFLDSFIDEGGNWHTRPVLDTQLANAYPIIDTDYVYHTLKRSQSTFRSYAGMGKDSLATLANIGITPWKMLKLVRLGYPVRNMGDNFIRMVTVAGAFPLLHEALGEAFPAFLHNRGLGMTAAQKAAYDLRSSLILERNEIDHDLESLDFLKGSAVRDAEGNPIRVYHGTNSAFDQFDDAHHRDMGWFGPGHYFTEDPAYAESYVDELHKRSPETHAGNVRMAYLNLKNPLDYDAHKFSESEVKDIFQRAYGDRAEEVYDHALPEGLRHDGGYLAGEFGSGIPTDKEADFNRGFRSWLEDHGFDGIKHIEQNAGPSGKASATFNAKSYVAFHASQIHAPYLPAGIKEMQARRQEIEKTLAANPMPTVDRGGIKRRVFTLNKAKDSVVSDHLGDGTITHAGYTLPDALGTSQNELDNFKALIDPRASFEQTLGIHANNVRKRMAQAYDYERITGSNEGRYGGAWEHAVNHQLAQSPLVQQILHNGEGAAKTWLRNTPEGRELVHRMYPIYKGDLDDMVSRASQMLDGTLGGSANLRETLKTRNLTFKDLQDEFGSNETKYPAVNAASIDATLHQGPGASIWNKALEGWFRVMSDLPERNLARHPMTVLFYRQHTRDMIDRALATSEADHLTVEDLNDIRQKALGLARRDMKRTLYDVTSTPNLGAGVFRYLFPFYSAFQDVMTKYGRILLDHPEAAARFEQVWDVPNNMGMVVDQNGNKVPTWHLGDQDAIVLPSIPGFGGISQWKMSKSSFNLVLQGDPFYLPGFGPLATYPANLITLQYPQIGATMNKLGILPYGASINAGDQIQPLPTWMQTLAKSGVIQGAEKHLPGGGALASGTTDIFKILQLDDPKEYNNTFAELAAVKAIDYNLAVDNARKTGGPMPKKLSEAEFFKQVGHETSIWLATKALAQGVMPTSQTPLSKFQFYFDQAHRYEDPTWQAQHPEVFNRFDPTVGAMVHYTPQQAFYADYPNYFEAMVSLSQSNVGGIKPTVQGFEASKKWSKEIAQYPQYGALFVGPGDDGSFSTDAYAAQFNTPVAPGSSTMQRSVKDPKQALNDIEVQKGWTRYMSAMSTLDVALHKAGYQSYNQAGAANLKQAKQAYTQYLMQDDPQWGAAFQQHDDGKFATFLQAAQAAVSSPNAKGRGDLQALGLYLDARKVFQQVLSQRKAAGGSASIDATGNQDLKNAFEAYGQYLKQRYVTFGDIYDRYLGQTERGAERDNLTVVLN